LNFNQLPVPTTNALALVLQAALPRYTAHFHVHVHVRVLVLAALKPKCQEAGTTMQPLLLALMLLLQQQQQLLGGSSSQRQLVGLTDDGRSAAALSDNLNSTLVPGKTIKAIERQMKAAGEVAGAPAEMLQVTPANQLPVNTPAAPARPMANTTKWKSTK